MFFGKRERLLLVWMYAFPIKFQGKEVIAHIKRVPKSNPPYFKWQLYFTEASKRTFINRQGQNVPEIMTIDQAWSALLRFLRQRNGQYQIENRWESPPEIE